MSSTISITSKDDFRTWQLKAQGLCMEAKDATYSLILKEYEDVLADYKTSLEASNRIIKEFTALCKSEPGDDCNEKIMDAHAAANTEIDRINGEFHKKWGRRYEEYLIAIDLLKKEHKRVMALTRSRAAYKKAMVVLAQREAEGGDHNA
jgi:hypothetical protein